jgi:hypothetical protein
MILGLLISIILGIILSILIEKLDKEAKDINKKRSRDETT